MDAHDSFSYSLICINESEKQLKTQNVRYPNYFNFLNDKALIFLIQLLIR